MVLVFNSRVVFVASQLHLADRALSLPTKPKREISQAPVQSARLPVKLSPDQISNLHDSKISGHSNFQVRSYITTKKLTTKKLTVLNFKSKKLIAITAQGWSLVSVVHCQKWTLYRLQRSITYPYHQIMAGKLWLINYDSTSPRINIWLNKRQPRPDEFPMKIHYTTFNWCCCRCCCWNAK